MVSESEDTDNTKSKKSTKKEDASSEAKDKGSQDVDDDEEPVDSDEMEDVEKDSEEAPPKKKQGFSVNDLFASDDDDDYYKFPLPDSGGAADTITAVINKEKERHSASVPKSVKKQKSQKVRKRRERTKTTGTLGDGQWIAAVVVIVAVIYWLQKQFRKRRSRNTARSVSGGRYAALSREDEDVTGANHQNLLAPAESDVSLIMDRGDYQQIGTQTEVRGRSFRKSAKKGL